MNNINFQLHKLGGIVVIILAFVLLLPLSVSAQNDDKPKDEPADSEVVHAVSVPEESLTDEQRAERRAERLAKNKAALQEKLDAAEEKRIAAKCKNAQKLLSAHQTRFDALQSNRTKVYDDVGERLATIVERLASAGVDTTELESMIVEYDNMKHAFSELATSHSASVGDLEELDCTGDPEAFKATLEAVRTEWKEMHDAAKAIRTYLIETIKPELLSAKDSIVGNNSDSTEENSSAENESETENATGETAEGTQE